MFSIFDRPHNKRQADSWEKQMYFCRLNQKYFCLTPSIARNPNKIGEVTYCGTSVYLGFKRVDCGLAAVSSRESIRF